MADPSVVTMTGVFISHSSHDEPLVDEFVDLLETTGVPGNLIFASSVPGRDFPWGVDLRKGINEGIRDAQVVVFLLSPSFVRSSWCNIELGAALALEKKVLFLAVPPNSSQELKDFAGDLVLDDITKPASLDKLSDLLRDKLGVEEKARRWGFKRDKFLKWIGSREIDADDQPWRERGFWDSSIVDGTLYIGNGYMRQDHTQAIVRTIKERRVLPTVYAYLTNAGYQNWIKLTEDTRYTYYRDAVNLYTRQAKRFAKKISGAIGQTNIDVISLGCGNGVKDQQVLRALAAQGSASGLYYYPFDINPSMISTAMDLVGRDEDLSEIRVKAILAEFDSLPQFYDVYQYREGPNVLMLLGNTLGNLPDEREFLERIFEHAMKEGDLFLLDVRNQEGEDTPEKELGTLKLNRRFDFGPLDILSVPYEPDKIEYDPPVGGVSKIPDTRTFRARYTKCRIKGEDYSNVVLSYIHRYNPDSLQGVLEEEIGFSLVDKLGEGSATSFLLQKPL